VAAIKAGQLGLKTACVEMRGSLGGTCLNVGCIPSKALLQSSHHYHDAKNHFAEHGIVITGDVTMDVDKMLEAKNKSVVGLTGGIEYLLQKYGVEYIKGKGKVTGPNAIDVALMDGGNKSLDTKNILIATGSEVTPLPPVPVDNAGGKVVDSTGALDLTKVPENMAVIGGGVIGLEMGSVWSRLGAKVTVIEFLDRICPSMDQETTKKFQTTLKKQGFKFKMKTKVTKSEVVGDGVVLTMEPSAGGDAKVENYDVVLVATGRRPYTEGLGLDELGIQTDKLGRIEVDEHFRTAVPSIYAIGDCIDGPMLAHKAEEEGIAAVETIAGFAGHVNYNAIPGKNNLSCCIARVSAARILISRCCCALKVSFTHTPRLRLLERPRKSWWRLVLNSTKETSHSRPTLEHAPMDPRKGLSRSWRTRRLIRSLVATSSAPMLVK
jgi:dihydrolipoamide dehydrogenase